MAQASKEREDLRIRNVTLYIGGQSEQGTLYLTRHHLLFSYIPKQLPSSAVSAPEPVRSSQAISAANSNATDTSTETNSQITSNGGSQTKEHHHKPRSKDVWVPYPMINHCVLRPSHSQQHCAHASDETEQSSDLNDNEDLFPPVFGTSTYERFSTDSTRLASQRLSPARPGSPANRRADVPLAPDSGRQPSIRLRRRDFQMMAFHFNSSASGIAPDEAARQVFFTLRSRSCVGKIEDLHAFHFQPPKEEAVVKEVTFDARREFARMGVSAKAADGPGSAWRLTDINKDYSYSPTYPSVLCVPRAVSDNMLKYGGAFRSRSRIPCLSYLHPNGGSITRSSQPMVGVQNKRNPQDERLVSAIFSSHKPPTISLDDLTEQLPSTATLETSPVGSSSLNGKPTGLPVSQSDTALDEKLDDAATAVHKKVYGSTRQNLIVDARPKINALANRATGGGIEDLANYASNDDLSVEKVFLNIANIHVMRASLEKVVESLSNADYVNMRPNQENLRKSGWLGHIAGLLEGSELVARVVGLGGSHVLVHCSDGWDRTPQVSALAQVMLDPYCRTLDGFINLIQKDFLSFGHKFRERNGVEGSEKWFEIENERIMPSPRVREGSSDPSALNAFGSKALSGAKNWFEKNRGNIFRPQNGSRESVGEHGSRSSSPPPNPVIHSPPTASAKDENSHKMSEKEIAPIFHQLLDAVYQLCFQTPNAFEFNERFLKRLFYQTYACQYGEFLFNTEKDRDAHKGKVPSIWTHFLVRRSEFTNPEYIGVGGDPLLFPRRHSSDREIDVRWWSGLFRCRDEDMNIPRVSVIGDGPTGSSAMFRPAFDVGTGGELASSSASPTPNGSIKETNSTPSLPTMKDSLSNSFTSLTGRIAPDRLPAANNNNSTPRPSVSSQNSDAAVLEAYSNSNLANSSNSFSAPSAAATAAAATTEQPTKQLETTGANLSAEARWEGGAAAEVAAPITPPRRTEKLDFAAFASQNAFRD